MSFFQNIKKRLAISYINSKQKKSPRKKEFHNLESAKSIGILFDMLDDKNHSIAKKFSEELLQKGYKVQTVGWIDSDELPDFGVAQKILFYTNKDVKWTGEPINQELTDFTNEKFDLLFILTESDHISVKYIAQLSKAACKVGSLAEDGDHLDLMIDQGKNKSLDQLINESLKYLSIIKK